MSHRARNSRWESHPCPAAGPPRILRAGSRFQGSAGWPRKPAFLTSVRSEAAQMPGAARRRDRGVRRRTRQSVEHADGAQRSRSGQMRRHSRRLVRNAGKLCICQSLARGTGRHRSTRPPAIPNSPDAPKLFFFLTIQRDRSSSTTAVDSSSCSHSVRPRRSSRRRSPPISPRQAGLQMTVSQPEQPLSSEPIPQSGQISEGWGAPSPFCF